MSISTGEGVGVGVSVSVLLSLMLSNDSLLAYALGLIVPIRVMFALIKVVKLFDKSGSIFDSIATQNNTLLN